MNTGFWWGNLRERDHLKNLGLDERIRLDRILRNNMVGHGLNSAG